MLAGSPLPNHDAEVHPWMPVQLHSVRYARKAGIGGYDNDSPLGLECARRGVSIHDREKVHAEMEIKNQTKFGMFFK